MPTTDLLSLAEARDALRVPVADTSRDATLTGTYIPALTALVEDIVGPVVQRSATYTADGGEESISLPSAAASITSLTLDGVAQSASSYVANLPAGIVYASAGTFSTGRQGAVITYSTGICADTASVPANIKLAARIILVSLWDTDQQGDHPALGGDGEGGTMMAPSGYRIPAEAYALLEPSSAVDFLGFA